MKAFSTFIKIKWIKSFLTQNWVKLTAFFPTLGTTLFQFLMITFESFSKGFFIQKIQTYNYLKFVS